jgi:DNA invertase Pin-like site-specific DNA recombinase
MSKQISITDKKYNPKKTLHIYMRVSTKVQSEDGTSLDTQKEIGIKRSKKLGMDFVIHNEGGKSSYKDNLRNRPIMRTLLDGMEKGIVKHLFVYNTDRLSRKRTTWYLIRLKIEKCRVTLHR